jgi:hypothetical protein
MRVSHATQEKKTGLSRRGFSPYDGFFCGARRSSVDLIYDFEIPEDETVIDVVRIANLDGYTPVIIEDEVGDIIAFQEDGTNNFQEDAAIQLVGVNTGLDTYQEASILDYIQIDPVV